MDDNRQQSQRPSGIPRPSRLPLPNKPTALHPVASQENLVFGGELRNTKLRSTPSTSSLRKKESPGNASPSLRSRVVSAQTPQSATPSHAAPMPLRGFEDVRPKKSPTLARRPSTKQFIPTAVPEPSLSLPVDAGNDSREGTEDNHLDGRYAHDTIRARPFQPRPSLSERTIETLSQIPSSPAVKGKASAFYDPGGVLRPPSRPGSSGSRPGSSYRSEGSDRPTSRPQSRPGSSLGHEESAFPLRASTNTFRGRGLAGRGRVTPGRAVRPSSSRNQSLPTARSRTPSPDKPHKDTVPSLGRPGSKTLAARQPKPRASLNGLFKKPSVPNHDRSAPSPAARKGSLASSSTSYEETNPSSASTTSTAFTADSTEPGTPSSSRKSSAALREQIAKAKAAKRAAARSVSESSPAVVDEVPALPTEAALDYDPTLDPFAQRRDDQSQGKVIEARVKGARSSGRLNIAAMGLREIPAVVMNMYDMESNGNYDSSWAESVDLTRFVAADNELEMIEDAIFPDQEPHEMADDEDWKGNIFVGLETLDLHGNMLISLPMGLRRLHLLTSLNLSQNRITNNALEVISQITSLRDLKLGGNLFYGPLDPCFSKLENLEIADLHGNNISALPLNLGNMAKLRILNISENNFESLVFEPLSKLPLAELLARKNRLRGVLIEAAVESLPSLQVLDVSLNQITHLVETSRSIALPALHQLCISTNRLQELPSVNSWTNLVTLSADENNVNCIPEGFTDLAKLRHVDFSSNDIRVIPPEVGRMENLAMLRLSGNPLRDKKLCTATTDELKEMLAARLEPLPSAPEQEPVVDSWPVESSAAADSGPHPIGDASAHPQEDGSDSRSDDDFATPPTSAPHSPARSRSQTVSNQAWPVKAGGVLDRASTESSSLHPVICSKIAAEHTIREIYLHRNLFTAFPDSLSFFADSLSTLSLSHNQLVGESYFGSAPSDRLDLLSLKELNLASNHITGLGPLINHLRAPALQKLDVSFNRLAALPAGAQLKDAFPNLAVLLLSNNHLPALDPDSICGLRIVDVMNNDIDHLNPRIGLLGGAGGLERLELAGNRFRVPRFNIIERGTEATLRWLRGRVPVAEMGAWREANSRGGEGGDFEDVD